MISLRRATKKQHMQKVQLVRKMKNIVNQSRHQLT
nr:MAG TPA: hypothetical protein [Caudoviricetes sp.]